MTVLKTKIKATGNSYSVLIPKQYLQAMKIDKKPLEAKFKMMTDGWQILLKRVKK